MTKKTMEKLLLLVVSVMLIFPVVQVIEKIASPLANEGVKLNVNVERVFYKFIVCINNKDEAIYDYIDTSNQKLYNDVKTYLNSVSVRTKLKEITEENGIYDIKAKMKVKGDGWKSARTIAHFQLKQMDDGYKIIDTDLFDKIAAKGEFFTQLRVAEVIFALIAMIIVVIVSISVLFIKEKKQPKDDNTNPIR